MSSARPILFIAAAGAAAAAVLAVARHRGASLGRETPGGILIANPAAYDALGQLFLRGRFRSIAADVAAQSPPGTTILDVGCGPGQLAILLARDRDLDVTGVDLDPIMIERARANAERSTGSNRRPTFAVGDVAALPFPDASFDLVVTTLSLHHWTDPAAGLTDIARVLRPGGRVLVWEFRQGFVPFHTHRTDPLEPVARSPLRVVGTTPWRWPWRFALLQRIELARRVDGQRVAVGQP